MKLNFRQLTSFIVVSAIAIFIASCTKEKLDSEHASIPGVKRHINATITGRFDVSKSFMNANNRLEWETGDQVNINGTYITCSNIRGANHDTADFEGDVYALNTGTKDVYWSVFPKTKMGTYNNALPSEIVEGGAAIDIELPATYTYGSEDITTALKDMNVMACRSEVATGAELNGIALKNLCSVLKIDLKTATGSKTSEISRVIISSCDGNLAGLYRFNSSYAVSEVSGRTYTNTVTVNFSSPLDISTKKTIYVLLPPTLEDNYFSITLEGTNGLFVNKGSHDVTLARNKIYTANITNAMFLENEIDNTNYYFSVGGSKKVVFSPGNLQWSATNGGNTPTTHTTATGTAEGTWRFAPNQWDYVGGYCDYGNVFKTNGEKCANDWYGSSYDGWLDLFAWGCTGYNNKPPYMDSDVSTDYGDGNNELSGTYYDWGLFNAIYNPKTGTTDAPGTWRLLTHLEWAILLDTRSATSRFAMATVNGVWGLILLPDNWNTSTYTLNSVNSHSALFSSNVITATDWVTLEKGGAVFLPAAGLNSVYGYGATNVGCYSTSTPKNSDCTCNLLFGEDPGGGAVYPEGGGYYTSSNSRFYQRSVRLVKDVE